MSISSVNFIHIVLFLILLNPVFTHAGAQGILGKWVTEGGLGIVDVYECNTDEICGDVVWIDPGIFEDDSKKESNDGQEKKDVMNTDPEMQSRSLVGMTILSGFRMTSENRWTRGSIYNPADGEKFYCIIKLKDNGQTLDIRGFTLYGWSGSAQTWTRPTEERSVQVE